MQYEEVFSFIFDMLTVMIFFFECSNWTKKKHKKQNTGSKLATLTTSGIAHKSTLNSWTEAILSLLEYIMTVQTSLPEHNLPSPVKPALQEQE